MSTIPLVNGTGSIPFRGLGTFKSSNNEGEAAVRMQTSCSSDEHTDGYVQLPLNDDDCANRSSMLCVLGIVTLTQLWPMVIKRRSDGLSSSKLFMSLMNIYVLIQVGSALKKVIPSVVKREELFIVTKVNHSFDSHYIDVRTLTHCTYSFGTHFTTPKMSNQTLTSRSSNSG